MLVARCRAAGSQEDRELLCYSTVGQRASEVESQCWNSCVVFVASIDDGVDQVRR